MSYTVFAVENLHIIIKEVIEMATCSFDRNIVLTPKAAEVVNRVLEEGKNYFEDAKPRTDAEIKKTDELLKKWADNGCIIN